MGMKEEILIRVAELYYIQGLNQNDISKMMNISRPQISRILEEARETGIVEIKVHSPIRKDHTLSHEVRTAFGLIEAVVISGDYAYEESLKRCGEAACQFVYTILENNATIGISWGLAVECFANALMPKPFHNINVLQMVGCLGTGNPRMDGLELALHISQKLNGYYSNIYAPLYVENETVCAYLLEEPQIKRTIDRTARLDIIVTGIGTLDASTSLLRAGYVAEEDFKALRNEGVVGHLLGRMFDKNGREVISKERFPIAAPLSALRAAHWSVGIAAAAQKAEATISAVKAGYINTLVIDQALAEEMLGYPSP
ncbi:MAG: hypothetical protein FWB97_05730 [Oscillospiraceae bacterium]|nr:hypothetical protein [Oscillospiraceae bacterium]